jgi:hypothetical protein
MAIYRLVYNFEIRFGQSETWLIERTVPGEAPTRLYFVGTRKEALAEVARLNALMPQKTE